MCGMCYSYHGLSEETFFLFVFLIVGMRQVVLAEVEVVVCVKPIVLSWKE